MGCYITANQGRSIEAPVGCEMTLTSHITILTIIMYIAIMQVIEEDKQKSIGIKSSDRLDS